MAFLVHEEIGIGFNLKQVAKITIEDCYRIYGSDKGSYYVTVWCGGDKSHFQAKRDELMQLFSDSVWMKVVPK